MNIEKRLSADGSYTLFNTDYEESYHSLRDGAVQETLCKHIGPPLRCLDLFLRPKIRILDICFGLGYNSFFTIWHYLSNGYQGEIEIYSPEKDGGIFEKLLQLTYPQDIAFLDGVEIKKILLSLWKHGVYTQNQWKIECFIGDALEYLECFEIGFFDVIYQDAFSPDKNPELWSDRYFCRLFALLRENGIITTYSQKRSVRDAAERAGFAIYEIAHEGMRQSRVF
ncbi:tRNA (5-methylaminomethyl-2-thiouridine)(34)-methyltransferase MnmD, partial [Helicobacter pametensis]|uniref:tRNA (5-methylaminomethyl-2-thiouridine)(34)-methyltransferase MnmD n=1 Tax=Helicobacter pametensis TaxID=95149 RepID=UPI0004ADBFAB